MLMSLAWGCVAGLYIVTPSFLLIFFGARGGKLHTQRVCDGEGVHGVAIKGRNHVAGKVVCVSTAEFSSCKPDIVS